MNNRSNIGPRARDSRKSYPEYMNVIWIYVKVDKWVVSVPLCCHEDKGPRFVDTWALSIFKAHIFYTRYDASAFSQ